MKTKINITTIWSIKLGVCCLLLASCKTIYRPVAVNVPLFKDKGEVQANVFTGTGGATAQLSYAMAQNFALNANATFDFENSRVIDTIYEVKDANSNYRNVTGDVGLGYYRTFGTDTSKMVSLFMGGGYGETDGFSDKWNSDFQKFSSKYSKFYIQPSYGWIKNQNEISGSLIFSMLNYHSFIVAEKQSFNHISPDVYLSPVVTLKTGFKQFKFFLQGGAHIPLKKEPFYTYSPFIFAVGFHLNFNRYKDEDLGFLDELE